MSQEQRVVVRFTFKPEFADQFLFEEDVEAGRYIQELANYTVDEAYDFIREFSSSLDGALLIVDGKKVIDAFHYTQTIDDLAGEES